MEEPVVIETRTSRIKNFVVTHKVGIAVAATAVVCVVAHRAILSNHNEFLKEHDLYDLYYQISDNEF